MSQPAKFISCLVAFSAPLCGPSRQAPIGCGCMRERTRKASLRSWARIAPASRTASAWARSAHCTCWRAAGSSTRCPTTGGGSTCCGRGITGATTTGGLQMPEWAPWGGPWISIEIFLLYLFLYLEANKIFPVCFLQLCRLLFLSDSLGGLNKIKGRNNVAFLTRVNRKHG